MIKKLYHGSSNIIEKPLFGYGKPYNDYGLGFYCTDSLEMAKEWGVGKHQDGYANCYEIECDGLQILELNAPKYCILHWLTVLLQNREFDVPSALAWEAKEYLLANFSVDYESCDAIIGYRADDSYFSFAQDFIMVRFLTVILIMQCIWVSSASSSFSKARRPLSELSSSAARLPKAANGMQKKCCATRPPAANISA